MKTKETWQPITEENEPQGLFGIAFRRSKNAFEIIKKINYKYKKLKNKIKCVLDEF
jgi:hypothetical protein